MRLPNWRVMGSLVVLGVFQLIAGCGGEVEEKKKYPAIVDLWDYSNPESSRTRFAEVAREAEAAGDDVYRAELLTQVARTYGLQGNFDEANATLDSVAVMPAAEHPRVRLRLALERGRPGERVAAGGRCRWSDRHLGQPDGAGILRDAQGNVADPGA